MKHFDQLIIMETTYLVLTNHFALQQIITTEKNPKKYIQYIFLMSTFKRPGVFCQVITSSKQFL